MSCCSSSMEVPAMLQAFLFWLVGACPILLSRYRITSAFDYGLPASVAKFPFVVGLYYLDDATEKSVLDTQPTDKAIPFCTGTIVTTEWVVTTRRCLYIASRHYVIKEIKNVKMVAGSAFAPINTSSIGRYTMKSADNFKVYQPNVYGMNEIFNWTEEEANNIKQEWGYFKDIKGINHTRYFVDIALIRTDTPWKISPTVQTAPFPIGFRQTIQSWWEDKVYETKAGRDFMEPCYAIGWGGWDESVQQVRMRYVKVKFTPYNNCELSYCTECSYCNKSIRVDPRVEACYKSYFHGDACEGDEGAPVWCPWMQTSILTREQSSTGAVMGFLSWRANCVGSNVPSIYVHSWNIYPIMNEVGSGVQFPPDLWVFEDSRP